MNRIIILFVLFLLNPLVSVGLWLVYPYIFFYMIVYCAISTVILMYIIEKLIDKCEKDKQKGCS